MASRTFEWSPDELGSMIESLTSEQKALVWQRMMALSSSSTHEAQVEDLRLVAYTVSTGDPPSAETLRDFLGSRLPGYMIPAMFVPLKTMPLGANGKKDREALPDPRDGGSSDDGSFVAPRNPVEEMFVDIWSVVLGADRVGVRDDFFALGGHSISATLLVARLRAVLDIEMPIRDLFEHPTIEKLIEHLSAASDNEARMARAAKLMTDLSEQPEA